VPVVPSERLSQNSVRDRVVHGPQIENPLLASGIDSKAAEREGGTIHAWYLTMGRYDAVLISEFPTDEACAKFTLSAGALGNISTETLKAFPEADYRKICGSF
jgi:hypothetical protein